MDAQVRKREFRPAGLRWSSKRGRDRAGPVGANLVVSATERRMYAYDSADKEGLGGISVKTVEVNGDVYIDNITILEGSTGLRQFHTNPKYTRPTHLVFHA